MCRTEFCGIQKHQAQTIEELLDLKEKLSLQLNNIHSLEVQINKIKSEIEIIEIQLHNKAKKLSKTREKAVPEIEKEMKDSLAQLGMPNAIIQVEKTDLAQLESYGKDKIKFLFSSE